MDALSALKAWNDKYYFLYFLNINIANLKVADQNSLSQLKHYHVNIERRTQIQMLNMLEN